MEEHDPSVFVDAFSNTQVSDATLEEAYRSIDAQTGFSVETVGEERLIHVSNETGEGTMRLATLMPGIIFTFNDFVMDSCFSGFSANVNHLSVNYCKAGRIEQAVPGGAFSYTAQGDFKITDFEHHAGTYVFPTGHYQGIAIDFDIELCTRALAATFEGFSIDLNALRTKFCHGHVPYVIHDFALAEHIFGGLYNVGLKKFKTYAQIAALNTLVLLDKMDYQQENQAVEYFHRTQVEKVKRAHALMTEDVSRAYTIEQLSDYAGLSATAFKACFKGVYGTSPYSYLRSYRMDRAAEMLGSTNRSVADIGASVGYDNPSKFTAAFKVVMGVTPSAYRREI